MMDKVLLKFFADVMYLKNVICFEEFDEIMECCNADDLDCVFEGMMRGKYNAYKRGDIKYEFK